MNSISPNLFVKDIQASLKFYQLLGFSVVAQVPDQGDLIFVMLKCGEVVILLQTLESLGEELPEISRNPGGSLLIYIQTKEIQKFFDSIQTRVNVLKGLEKTFYGATEFTILDPDGFVLTFAEDELQ